MPKMRVNTLKKETKRHVKDEAAGLGQPISQQGIVSDVECNIKITDCKLVGGFFSQHIEFIVTVPGRHPVSRRYSDFLWLRALLQKQFAGVFLPPLPPKLPVAMWPDGYLSVRRVELQRWLNRVRDMPAVGSRSGVFEMFLSRPDGALSQGKKHFEAETARMGLDDLEDNVRAALPHLDFESMEEVSVDLARSTDDAVSQSKELLRVAAETAKQWHKVASRACEDLGDIVTTTEKMRHQEATLRTAPGDVVTADDDEEAARQRALSGKYDWRFFSQIAQGDRPDVHTQLQRWNDSISDEASLLEKRVAPTLERETADLEALWEICERRSDVASRMDAARAKVAKWAQKAQKSPAEQRSEEIDAAILSRYESLYAVVSKAVQAQVQQRMAANVTAFNERMTEFARGQLRRARDETLIWQDVSDSLETAKRPTIDSSDSVHSTLAPHAAQEEPYARSDLQEPEPMTEPISEPINVPESVVAQSAAGVPSATDFSPVLEPTQD